MCFSLIPEGRAVLIGFKCIHNFTLQSLEIIKTTLTFIDVVKKFFYTRLLIESENLSHLIIGTKFASPFVVVYEELQAVAFVKATLVGYRVYQDESICPSDVQLESYGFGFLEKERIVIFNYHSNLRTST